MTNDVFIHSIGTACPSRVISQEEMMKTVMSAVPDDGRLPGFINKIYAKSGIEQRYTVISDFKNVPGSNPFIPSESLQENGPTTSYRNGLYRAEAGLLAVKSAMTAIDKIPTFDKNSITHLVTASCTGFSSPGIDFQIINTLGLSPRTERFNIGFMGCFAAFPSLRLARSLCLSEKNARVLIVCTELCSLHYRHKFDDETLISNSLFADGSAAAVLSQNYSDGIGHGYNIKGFASRLIGGSKNDMSWIIGDHGFEMTLSQTVPSAIEKNILSLIEETSAKSGISAADISKWALHPGGRAILDQAAITIGTGRESMAASYDILREFGNMSSSTVLFVLDRLSSLPGSKVFTASFGPGLSAECGILEAY